jgi:hypothetical protein
MGDMGDMGDNNERREIPIDLPSEIARGRILTGKGAVISSEVKASLATIHKQWASV